MIDDFCESVTQKCRNSSSNLQSNNRRRATDETPGIFDMDMI
jgi:hypothetical protein